MLPIRIDVIRNLRLVPDELIPLVHRGLVALDHPRGRLFPLLKLPACV